MKVVLLGTTAACVLGFRQDLIKALVARGDQVYAVALDYSDSTRQRVRELGGVPVDYTFSRSGLSPLVDVINTFRLARTLRNIQPDVVFSYFSKPVIFGAFAAWLAGCKRRIGMLEGLGYVFTDGPNGIAKKTLLLRRVQVFLYRLSFPLLERIVFLNPDDPVDLVDSYRIRVSRVDVVGGIGLDLCEYSYSKPTVEPVSFIFVGRLLAEKGIREYVAAAKVVRNIYPDVQFVVLGAIDEDNPGALSREELEALVSSGVVVYPGQVDNVHEWLARTGVFVLPSYREGVPRSTQEAMAIGRPVITTNVPGCRETVVDGVNGFLVRPWCPDELAVKMMWFIENPGRIEVMGLESRRLAQERFDSSVVNAKLIEFIVGS